MHYVPGCRPDSFQCYPPLKCPKRSLPFPHTQPSQKDLPPEQRYGSKNGMTVRGSEVTSPVAMWLHALEALLQQLKVIHIDRITIH